MPKKLPVLLTFCFGLLQAFILEFRDFSQLTWKACGKSMYPAKKGNQRGQKLKRIFSAYVRLSKFFIDLMHSIPKFHRHVSDAKLQWHSHTILIVGCFNIGTHYKIYKKISRNGPSSDNRWGDSSNYTIAKLAF